MINIREKSFIILAFSFLILFMDIEQGYTGSKTLMINPVRVIFEGRQRTVQVNVGNINPEPVKYRVSLVTMRQDEKGSLVKVENETDQDKFIKSMIRFSPKQATIAPGKRQVVKIMVRKPADLPQGEYQTRLQFMPLTNQPEVSQNQELPTAETAQIKVDLIVGVTIPVIIQHGKANTQVTPEGIGLSQYLQAPSGLAAVITLARSGDFSAFGDVLVSHIDNSGKNKHKIARGESVGLYIPDSHRTFAVPIPSLENVDLNSGKLRVEFFHYSADKRTPEISYKDFPLSQ